MQNIIDEYLYNLKNIRCRRPLHKNQKNNFLIKTSFCALFLAFVLIIVVINWQNFQNHRINSKADNQTLNWINAESIYEFKIQKLDESFLYLSELKNKVLLIVK
jgi:hypothetical protein